MPQNEIRIIKSPVVPLYAPDEERIISSNELTYYVRLSNGVIATKPEDFPNDKSEKEIEEEVVDS